MRISLLTRSKDRGFWSEYLKTKLLLLRASKPSLTLLHCAITVLRPEKISTELSHNANQVPVDVLIRGQKWQWVGHDLSGWPVGHSTSTWRRTVVEECWFLREPWRKVKRISLNQQRKWMRVMGVSMKNRKYPDRHSVCSRNREAEVLKPPRP